MGKKVVGKIYKTKHGQPYKILANGRARFIRKTAKKGGSLASSLKTRASKIVRRSAAYGIGSRVGASANYMLGGSTRVGGSTSVGGRVQKNKRKRK